MPLCGLCVHCVVVGLVVRVVVGVVLRVVVGLVVGLVLGVVVRVVVRVVVGVVVGLVVRVFGGLVVGLVVPQRAPHAATRQKAGPGPPRPEKVHFADRARGEVRKMHFSGRGGPGPALCRVAACGARCGTTKPTTNPPNTRTTKPTTTRTSKPTTARTTKTTTTPVSYTHLTLPTKRIV